MCFVPLLDKRRGQRNRSSTVVVNIGFCIGFGHPKIGVAKFDSEKFEDAFFCGVDIGLARALGGLVLAVLADGTPCDEAAEAAYYIAGEGEFFKFLSGGLLVRKIRLKTSSSVKDTFA